MAKISIEVGEGEGDFTIMRDGEAFSLREGESIVVLGEGAMVLSGDEPIHVMHLIFPADLDGGGDDEPDGEAAPVAANDADKPEPTAMAA